MDSLNLFTAAELKQGGITVAMDHANLKHDGWVDEAYAALRRFLNLNRINNKPFMCETVRDFAHIELGLEKPPSNRAWGGVFQRAAHEKIIKRIGYGQVSNPKAHMANASLWVRS